MANRPAGPRRYLYAIAPSTRLPDNMPAGIDGASVHVLAAEGIAAVVSDTALARIRPERRHLSAHHAVVQSLMRTATILPVAFGMIATSENALRKMLRQHHGALAAELARLAGHAEFAVRIVWDVPNIFEHLVGKCADLRAARDELAALGHAATRDDKIELGSLFERVLEEERARHTDAVEAALAPCCREIRASTPRHESEVVRLDCLAPSDAGEVFAACVGEASSRLDDSFLLSYNGPWPPHHFVSLNISV